MAGNTHNFIVSSIISNFFPEKSLRNIKKVYFYTHKCKSYT